MSEYSEHLYLSLAYDFYGELLTEKQKTIFDMHHGQDLSLSEVGQQLQITPQGVRDSFTRTVALLKYYEEKLCCIDSFYTRKNILGDIYFELESLQSILIKTSDEQNQVLIQEKINLIKSLAEKMLG